MSLAREGKLLRVFIGDADHHHGRPLHDVIVERARAAGLAGATVLKGSLGFGASSVIHTARVLRLSDDLPVVIEMVDSEEKIDSFLPVLDELVTGGLVTLERVQVIAYRGHPPKQG